jgi:hypothetical protein
LLLAVLVSNVYIKKSEKCYTTIPSSPAGCNQPASSERVWPCRMTPACAGNEHVLYGWGKDAPAVSLPEGAAFSVGPGSGIRTVVLQVHYLNVRPHGDASGIKLRLSPHPMPSSAGIVAYAASFEVPPRRSSHLVHHECCYSGMEAITGFGYRVHTHSLGRSVRLERHAGDDDPEVLAVQDPQLPQGFYPLKAPVSILPGDKLEVTCDFDSSLRDRPTVAGHTASDEMCNLYLMVHSKLPFFMWCVDGREWVDPKGPGGIPAQSALQPEHAVWTSPAPAGAAPLGQAPGVATSADGTLWVLRRGRRVWSQTSFDSKNRMAPSTPLIAEDVVLKVDADTGAVKESWGTGTFLMPHMITEDPAGNVWIVGELFRHLTFYLLIVCFRLVFSLFS